MKRIECSKLPASTGFVTSGTQTRNTDAATYSIGQNNPTYKYTLQLEIPNNNTQPEINRSTVNTTAQDDIKLMMAAYVVVTSADRTIRSS